MLSLSLTHYKTYNARVKGQFTIGNTRLSDIIEGYLGALSLRSVAQYIICDETEYNIQYTRFIPLTSAPHLIAFL